MREWSNLDLAMENISKRTMTVVGGGLTSDSESMPTLENTRGETVEYLFPSINRLPFLQRMHNY